MDMSRFSATRVGVMTIAVVQAAAARAAVRLCSAPACRRVAFARRAVWRQELELRVSETSVIEYSKASAARRRAARRRILPFSLPPRGLHREEAAAYIGVGGTKFDDLVRMRLMPGPRVVGARRIWDRNELDIAFSELPHAGEEKDGNPWDQVSA
jgi:hypothetical protein